MIIIIITVSAVLFFHHRGCSFHSDCPKDKVCFHGNCYVPRFGSCTSSEECRPGTHCEDGICVVDAFRQVYCSFSVFGKRIEKKVTSVSYYNELLYISLLGKDTVEVWDKNFTKLQETIKSPEKIRYSDVLNGELYITTMDDKLFKLNRNGTLVPQNETAKIVRVYNNNLILSTSYKEEKMMYDGEEIVNNLETGRYTYIFDGVERVFTEGMVKVYGSDVLIKLYNC